MQQHLHSIEDAKKAIGVGSRSKMYDLAHKGEIALVKIGRRTFVTDESLVAFVERLKASPLFGTAKRAI